MTVIDCKCSSEDCTTKLSIDVEEDCVWIVIKDRNHFEGSIRLECFGIVELYSILTQFLAYHPQEVEDMRQALIEA